MPTYETLFITSPDLAEDDEATTIEQFSRIVTEGGGAMHAHDRMGRRRLAYPIRKFEDGVYTRLLYDADLEVPRELERRLRLSDRVLRSLTVRLERDWAQAAKEEAVREAQRRVEEEAAAKLAEEEAARKALEEPAEPAAGEEPATETAPSAKPTSGTSEAAAEAPKAEAPKDEVQ